MKPPATVKVGPHLYDIVVVPRGTLLDAGCAGTTTAHRLTIALDPELAPSQVADTLLHEVVHTLLDATTLDAEDEERVARCLGPGLLAVLRDNPELVEYITKG